MTDMDKMMIEKVARALAKACGRNPDAILNGVPEWVYRQVEAKAVITAYNPDDRLSQEVENLTHDLERQMTIANIECNEAERLREACERAKVLIGAMNDNLHEAVRQSNINAAWHILDAALRPVTNEYPADAQPLSGE